VRTKFFASVHTGPGGHPVSYTVGTESFLEVTRPVIGVDYHSHIAPKLKKEYSYNSILRLCLHGLFTG